MYFLFRPVSRITCCRQHGSFIATLQDFLPQDYLHQAAPREVVSFRRPWRIYYPRTQDLLSEPDSRKEIISFRRQDDSVSMSHVRRVEQVQLFTEEWTPDHRPFHGSWIPQELGIAFFCCWTRNQTERSWRRPLDGPGHSPLSAGCLLDHHGS